jgi:hypothetical protein
VKWLKLYSTCLSKESISPEFKPQCHKKKKERDPKKGRNQDNHDQVFSHETIFG